MRLALGAELLKLRRQRHALFWGFVFVPIFMALIGFALAGGLRGLPADVEQIRPLRAIARALSVGGNPIAQLFYAVGAAAIFAVEYRHSGWRHLVPRTSRESLILSKFLAFALATALSLTLIALSEALISLVLPLIQGVALENADAPGAALAALLSYAISLAELLTLGAMTALVAIATRSAMAAILLPFLLAMGTALAQAYLGPEAASIPLPLLAAGTLRVWANTAMPEPELTNAALIAAGVLTAWLAASLAGAFALFARQDLVSE